MSNFFIVFLIGLLVGGYLVFKAAFAFLQFRLNHQDEIHSKDMAALAWQNKYEASQMIVEVHKDYSGGFAGMTERLFNAVLSHDYSLQPQSLNTPSPTSLDTAFSGDMYARTHARTEQNPENTPLDVVYRGTRKFASDTISYSTNAINIEVDGIEYKAEMPIQRGEKYKFVDSTDIVLKGLFALICKEKTCVNRIVTDIPHTEYCSDKCKNKYNHNK